MWPIAKESEIEESRRRGTGISDNDQANWSYMSNTENLSLAEIEDLSLRALMEAGTSEANACPLAVATAATEAAGVASHGQATPIVNQTRPSVVTVDAATGFAHSAIELGFEHLQRDADVRTNKEDLLAQVELARNLRELAGLVGTVRNARVFKVDAKVTDDADARQPMHIVHTVPMNGTGAAPERAGGSEHQEHKSELQSSPEAERDLINRRLLQSMRVIVATLSQRSSGNAR